MAAVHALRTEAEARAQAAAAGKDADWWVAELRNHDLIVEEPEVTPEPEPMPAAQQGGEGLRLVPAVARPLYDLETHLAALLDTEDVVPVELEREYALELHATLLATVEKRDRVGQFRQHLKAQINFAHGEAARLREREVFFTSALDRMDSYITRVIESLGVDAKGKRKKLDGKVLTLSLHGCDQRVDVLDEEAVPARYKRVTVTLPAETWETVCDSLDMELRDKVVDEARSQKLEVSLTLAKVDLKADVPVPGCVLAGGTYVEVK